MKGNVFAMVQSIAQVIYEKKGLNILALDVQGLSSINDFLLIAEGNVDRHVMSIARAIIDKLSEQGEKPLYTEGLKAGDWIALDYGQIAIHLFAPGLRIKYSLERLWPASKLIELDIRYES